MMSSSHSLCDLPLLFFSSILSNITSFIFLSLCILHNSMCPNSSSFLPVSFCMIFFFSFNVEQFTYLGSNTTYDLNNMREDRTRLEKATAALKAIEKVWKCRSIQIETKKRVLQTCVFSI